MKKNIKTLWHFNAITNSKQDTIGHSYKFINKWKGRKDFLKDPQILKDALSEYEEWLGQYAGGGDLGYYYSLKYALDQNNPKIKAKLAKINEQTTKIENDIQFFEHKLSKIPINQQKAFLASASLKTYRHYLERLFKLSKYLLSEKEEKILNLTYETSYSNWVQLTSSILSKEEYVVLTESGVKQKKNFSEITSLINSQNKKVRESASKAFNRIVEKNSDIAENELNSILQNKKTIDELKKIKRPDKSRHLADDIETEVVDSLIKAVSDNFAISKKYYKLKAKLMNVKKLKYYERNVEYGKIQTDYKYKDAIKLIEKILRKLDPQFSKIFSDLITGGYVDVYPKAGKTSGAFCAGGLISQPNYILLNYTNKLTDVLTLAHETGHAINNFLSKEKQSPINYGVSLATAEVASTFIEDFVLEELLRDARPKERLSLLMHKLNEDISTIFRQVACYKFELDLHKNFREKGYLSKSEIGELFKKNMAAYMGEFVEQSKGSENWWVHWSHIRTFFYVYSYASGLLISKSLQSSVKENPKNISKVKSFLSAGTSASPYQIFKGLGIDISNRVFWARGLRKIENLLLRTAKEAKVAL